MPRGRKAKLPFEDLDKDFQSEVDSMTDQEIRQKMAQVSINEHENREAKKADQDLESKRVLYNEAGEQYREASAGNKQRISYCYSVLEARGKL